MEPRHRIIRECLRHYLEFESLIAHEESDQQYVNGYTLTYGDITISFLDLQGCLKKLSKRKKEALFYNVILDWKQKDVAEKMGITTVSVGQYVQQGCEQIEKELFRKE